jgi:hypothetical protein
MRQPAIPIKPMRIARDAKSNARALSSPRVVIRSVKDHLLRLLRKLGDFAAAGGPLS